MKYLHIKRLTSHQISVDMREVMRDDALTSYSHLISSWITATQSTEDEQLNVSVDAQLRRAPPT